MNSSTTEIINELSASIEDKTVRVDTPSVEVALLKKIKQHLADLTEQNNILVTKQNELLSSQALYSDLYHQAPVGYCIINSDGLILKANSTSASLLGESLDSLKHRNISELVCIEDIDTYLHFIMNLFLSRSSAKDNDTYSCELRLLREDGCTFWALLVASISNKCSAEMPVARLVIRDISARRLAEEELIKKHNEVEQFIYTVSHDLRSPLVTVKIFLGYLQQDMAEGNHDKIAQDISYVTTAADKMALMLDELLEMSRIGRIDSKPVKVAYSEVISDVLASLAGDITQQDIEVHPPTIDLLLFGNRQRFCQIWQNLIENSIKYSRDDCKVHIDLGVHIIENCHHVFYVKDNGVGIAPEYQTQIFKVFEKLDASSQGVGLGLSMIQRIVDTYGGKIWVESEGKNTGSCFFFTLPNAVVQI